MEHWASVIPFVVIIVFALWTKQVLPGLFIGLLIASLIVEGSFLGGMDAMSSYIITNLTKDTKLQVIGFLYIFAGIIQMTKMTGGIKGFIELVSNRIQTKKQAIFLSWLSLGGTFISPNLRIVTVAPIMKAIQNKLDVKKERLSFVIEATALPVIALIPVATAFIGYMTTTIELALENTEISGDAYLYFLKSIPFNFFSITTIVLALVYSVVKHPKIYDQKDEHKKEEGQRNDEGAEDKGVRANVWNLVIPLFLAISLSVLLSWWDGYQQTPSMIQAFMKANVTKAMFHAILITLVITFLQHSIDRYSLKELLQYFFEGGNKLIPAFFLFALVWGLASATKDLGLSSFVTETLGVIPESFIPPITFLLGSVLAYFVGSAWGSWGLLMPIGVSLATTSDIPLPLLIGIVFASGTVGGLVSPLSATTATMSKIMGFNTVTYSGYKLKHSAAPFLLSLILYGLVTLVF
ncbi:sodium:proton antiporter [Pontibacillus yanchengensis]|uniref:Sodium:proton antiporter n=2 Tax=Pontibacillus yanchengensis TaxID=462910 RepID=A0ACC7VCN8_9BACI|nr:Na+/H+ antiporter NhaC family protein [Pontibacillus yanchengensis]MYL32153.1 sodium:proton antiporter [Pontibacillus yanchengensis]MYL52733.1 sodium:proton antiporter [Pontibacillus yanchengensis]